MNARRWFYGQPGFHQPRPGDVATEARVLDEGVPLPPDTDRVPYAETVPTIAGTADRLRPYLTLLSDRGWPGLSERDRTDVTNLRADLEAAFARTVR